jgi:hypothetical protein
MNNATKPTCINLRTVAVNSDCWNLCLDPSTLDDDEILHVVNYLLSGKIAAQYNTPKIAAYIQGIYDRCVENLMNACFEYGLYDHCYTIDIILTMMELDSRCKDSCTKEIEQLERMNQELQRGRWGVHKQIRERLIKFFSLEKPFVFDVL